MTSPEPTAKFPSLEDVLEQQGGVLSRQQALGCGLTAEGWRWRLDDEQWQTLLPGVVVTHTGPAAFAEKVQAAVLYGGAGAAVSGQALVHLTQGSRRRGEPPPFVDIAVDPRCQIGRRDFFRPHRCSRLAELTHPVRTPRQVRIAPGVLHQAAWAPAGRVAEWRVAAAVQQRLVTVPQLRDALVLLPRLPRRRLVREVLDDVELGAHARTELDFLRFLRRHGLPLPDRLQFEVRASGKRYLDAWWERQRVAAEIDGAHHIEVGSWDDDTLRANAVVVATRADRVLLLRVTGGNLRHAEAELSEQFRAVLL